jgi:PAS domain S-box-containing protein
MPRVTRSTMEGQIEDTTDEIRQLKACINDLVSMLALPAIWCGRDPSQIGTTLLDALVGMLRLDFAYLRLNDSFGTGAPTEMLQVAQSKIRPFQREAVGQALNAWLSGESRSSRLVVPNPSGEGKISIVSRCLGLQDEIGVLLVGSVRADFPNQTERLLLDVAANQAVIGLHGAQRLVEQKKVAEELDRRVAQRTTELAEREGKIRRLVDANIVGIFIWELEGRILEANDAFLRILGYDREDLVSGRMRWTDLTPPEWLDRDERLWAPELKRTGRLQPFEKEYFRKDGSRVPVLIGLASFEETGNQGVAFVLDLTERKRAEQERERLRQAQADLAYMSRVTTLGELAGSLAHEIKQPIAAAVINAKACVRWLQRNAPDLAGACEAALRMVRDAKRAADIVDRVRALYRRDTPERELVDVNEIIREMIALLHHEANRYSIAIRTELAESLPKVMADRVQVQQVLMNLMLNGIEAMKDGAGELVLQSQRSEDGQLLISVSDSGVGIPSEQADRIFDAFFTTKPHGTGMGLAISRTIIESHGGRLWARPNSGRGAIFCFTLPATVEPQPSLAKGHALART